MLCDLNTLTDCFFHTCIHFQKTNTTKHDKKKRTSKYCCKFPHAGLSHLITTYIYTFLMSLAPQRPMIQFTFRQLLEHKIQSMLLPSRRVISTDKINHRNQQLIVIKYSLFFLVFNMLLWFFFIRNDNKICNKLITKNAYSWSKY